LIYFQLYDKAPEYMFSTTWLTEMAASFDNLMKDAQSALKLTEILSGLDQFNLMDLLGNLQVFLNENSPDRIFDE
jgi:hypothetical protein